jgi:hypothetical protein
MQLHQYLTTAPHAVAWSASHPGHLSARETASSIHYIRGWVGVVGGQDPAENRKISCSIREWNLDSLVMQCIAEIPYKLSFASVRNQTLIPQLSSP